MPFLWWTCAQITVGLVGMEAKVAAKAASTSKANVPEPRHPDSFQTFAELLGLLCTPQQALAQLTVGQAIEGGIHALPYVVG